jgi:TolB protein
MKLNSAAVIIAILLCAQGPSGYSTAAQNPHRASNGLIAFTLRDQNRKLQIFTENPDGSNQKQLTFEGDNGRPAWSPDGKKITFGAYRDGKRWVGVMEADGSNQKLIAEGTDPDWSPDGRQIAFSSADGQIWVMSTDGSNKLQVTRSATHKSGPSWSPEGKRMVFTLVGNRASRTDFKPQVGIMNSDGTNERILTTEDRTNVHIEPDGSVTVLETAHDAGVPAWSPVEDKIAFFSGIARQHGQVWAINADGTGSKQLTETRGSSEDPSWSPDGKQILFSTGRSGRNELWVMDAEGKNQRKVSNMEAYPYPGRATWQPVR